MAFNSGGHAGPGCETPHGLQLKLNLATIASNKIVIFLILRYVERFVAKRICTIFSSHLASFSGVLTL